MPKLTSMPKPHVSVIIPAYNEEGVLQRNVEEIISTLSAAPWSWEIILVNDGSSDNTGKVMELLSRKYKQIRAFHHPFNRGRGAAMRTGFDNAGGDIIVTLDADLSYSPRHVTALVAAIEKSNADIVQGSPYMKGGRAVNVPFFRLFLSRMGNKILTLSFGHDLTVVTGILRAYRRHVLDSLNLKSEGKDIHLEIMSKALDLGFKVKEIPAVLRWRKVKKNGKPARKSKFKLARLLSEHLAFTFSETPFLLLGSVGLLFVLAGLLLGFYIIYLWLHATLDPTRPIVYLMVLLLLSGIQGLMFAFLASQNRSQRRELIIIQSQLRNLDKKLKK
ncbi:glycosyltransferase family 2 protein [Candidatus Woesearchaeota archaeon]|nr:MAG: glycosyltransferase family 2 protein [Candidatus Woesearchaeota archaeon]